MLNNSNLLLRLRQPLMSWRQSFQQSSLHTSLNARFIKIDPQSLSLVADVDGQYPTLNKGLSYDMAIFGLRWKPQHTTQLQNVIWQQESFLPTKPAQPLLGSFQALSDVAQNMAIELPDGTEGLLARNQLRKAVQQLPAAWHFSVLKLLQKFQTTTNPLQQNQLAHTISDVAFWSQWLIRGVLFEGKLHGERFTEGIIPAPLSTIAAMTNAALGRQQLEFVYDDYTLKAATLPGHVDFEALDYDNPVAILEAIGSIRTPVGFNDMQGGRPEHNFRFNHVLMEWQMRGALRGFNQVLAGDVGGWQLIATAAERAHKVFKTMLVNTPAESYPAVRLPIKGVRGALGSVYPLHGVFYEGIGADEFLFRQGLRNGIYVDNEWGQTGANSSMYKWFDIVTGTAQLRHAYASDPQTLEKLAQVLLGERDSGELGDNPIDSMQRAFDLLTRPDAHMKMLVDTHQQVQTHGLLEDQRPEVLLQRLRVAFWVAEHRMVHGQYVMAAIYKTTPIGGQSRSQGTGGSTPPFLKLFLDQTHQAANRIIEQLRRQSLTPEQQKQLADYEHRFAYQSKVMTHVRNHGIKLEKSETHAS